MPLLTTIADITGKSLFNKQTYTNTSYFTSITKASVGTGCGTFSKIPVGLTGNIYIGGYTLDATQVPYLEVIGPTGAQVSVRGQTTPFNYYKQPAVDSLGNFYAMDGQAALTKWNSAGTIQYSQIYSLADTALDYLPILADYAGNAYMIASTPGVSNAIKISPTGTIVWQRALTIGGNGGATSQYMDSVGNIYHLHYSFTGIVVRNYTAWIYMREPTAGTIVGNLYSIPIGYAPSSFAVSPIGDTYIIAGSTSFATTALRLVKITAAGVATFVDFSPQWGGSGGTVMVDNSGNIWVCDTGAGVGLLHKFSANLDFIFTREITDLGPTVTMYSNGIHPSGDILSAGEYKTSATTSLTNTFVLRVPPDGSKEGTYSIGAGSLGQNMTYIRNTNTTITGGGSLTVTSQTISDAAGSATLTVATTANATSTVAATVVIF